MSKILPVRPVEGIRHGWHLFRNRKTLFQMLREVFAGSYRMSWITNIVALFGVVYIVCPFDLIPDFIPILGWIDDAAVFYLLLRRLVYETQRYNRHKAMERKNTVKTIDIS